LLPTLDKDLQLLFQELQHTFTKGQLEEWAVETGFMKRKTKVKPEHFLLLCSCLGESFGKKSLVQLCAQLCATFNLELTTEGLNQRFNPQAVKFLKKIFESIFSKQVAEPITEKRLFNRIRILDSTSFDLLASYNEYKGTNGSGVKLQLEYELYQATFLHLLVQEGKESDSKYSKVIRDDIKPGDLCLRDLGYFSVDNLNDIDKKGGYFLSRMKNNMNLYHQEKDGTWAKIDLAEITKELKRGEVMELQNIKIGYWVKEPLISRVIIAKLTEEQEAKRQSHLDKKKKKGKKPLSAQKNISINIYLTNIPKNMVKKEEIHPLYSLRWQIEILFKTWKSLFEIHRVKKMKKERFECHLYGTLIQLLLCSTLAFQCRRMLYIKHQMETSEYKSISIAKECLSLFKDVVVNQNIFAEICKKVYRSIKINGRKCRRQQKKTVFDILKIAYKQTIAIAS
jgi:Transposase DDE domain